MNLTKKSRAEPCFVHLLCCDYIPCVESGTTALLALTSIARPKCCQ